MPRALITGITGQDGSYLADFLIGKGYEVHGLVRPTTQLQHSRLSHLCNNLGSLHRQLIIHRSDLSDSANLRRVLTEVAPQEVYHLASQSQVALSVEQPETTCEVTGLATLRLLEIVRRLPRPPRFFHASSSEVFGLPEESPQDEQTPFRPVNPYGCAKTFATQMVSIYRQTHRLFACNGILYNHESPRRGAYFVTQKVCRAAAAIKRGHQNELPMGSLTARRDWGDAREYVQAMWLMLQQASPDDYVLATGELHSVQEVVEIAFNTVGLDWRDYVRMDPQFVRSSEPTQLVGNPAKAGQVLNWRPRNTFKALIAEMTLAALNAPPANAIPT
jgi:GDPmannose 4,6-dehydratase